MSDFSPATERLLRLASLAQERPLAPLERRDDLFRLLELWVQRGWLRQVDRAFTGFLGELEPQGDSAVLLAAALASHQLGHGHVCLDLAATLRNPDAALSLPPEGDEARASLLPSQLLHGQTLEAWQRALLASDLVDGDGSCPQRPLVLGGERLYLRRYWNYERAVAASLRQRLATHETLPADLAERLDRLFPPDPDAGGEPDWQKLACALAVRGAFSIVTGGPGTGKTTTVVRLLALLQAPAVAAGRPLRIRLAAPTGKAAARLTESIGGQVSRLPVDEELRRHIPTGVTTVHRLLGSRPNTRHFRHHRGHPLPLDVLVVDEASMIDLEMMASLLAALPPRARLVLLGDKDQLASVEAGAVLGDLCRDAEAGRYSPATRAWLEAVSGQSLVRTPLAVGDDQADALAQQVVMLRRSRRFGAGSGIGQLARRVNAQDGQGAQQVLIDGGYADLHRVLLKGPEDRALERLVLEGRGRARGYRHYLEVLQGTRPQLDTVLEDPAWTLWAGQVLSAFDDFQLLCAVRKGPWGVEGLNLRIASALLAAGLLAGEHGWYEGRPVLVTRNDYSLGLMNGDIGITLCLPDATHPGRKVLRVAFPRGDGSGGLRFVLPSRLAAVETVFAMTVHKSQGSEFAHTALLLPEQLSPVLTKELVYTGITRARDDFTLIEARSGIFAEAVARRVRRVSGLDLDLRNTV
ncbi:exodeoxyribonuclease V subunit alpha [Pseudomonas oryzihabitans]|uniref:exodeoxyribonuclease V subunit alpha n=1 Tax=Pseudomonas oryzihabitans TaxID=47885 RepID=UPI0011A7407D|nr:exodeoxyribonuclease V subunit alpha [Pseudomonas oryzihabitans]